MSRTLILTEQLLALGRNFQDVGRHQDAARVLGRLSAFLELPAEVAEEAQSRLADLALCARDYPSARRHLTAALGHDIRNARYHHLLAVALERDPEGDDEQALEHYRQSLELDPDQPRCLGEFGLLAVRQGHFEEGLGALSRAVELTPNDPEAVGRLATGLRHADRDEEARAVLRAARFRNPRDGRFRALWDEHRFQELLLNQEAGREEARLGAERPTVLPFVPTSGGRRPASGRKRMRVDGPNAEVAGPHGTRPIWQQA